MLRAIGGGAYDDGVGAGPFRSRAPELRIALPVHPVTMRACSQGVLQSLVSRMRTMEANNLVSRMAAIGLRSTSETAYLTRTPRTSNRWHFSHSNVYRSRAGVSASIPISRISSPHPGQTIKAGEGAATIAMHESADSGSVLIASVLLARLAQTSERLPIAVNTQPLSFELGVPNLLGHGATFLRLVAALLGVIRVAPPLSKYIASIFGKPGCSLDK
jgi:hypothetical protein